MNRIIPVCAQVAAALIVLSSCATQNVTISQFGDTADVSLKRGEKFAAELVAVSDSSFLFLIDSATPPLSIQPPGPLVEIPYRTIDRVIIPGYSNTKWKAASIAFGFIPAAVLGITAATYDGGDASGLRLIPMAALPTALGYALLKRGTPKPPQVDAPVHSEDGLALRKYARYPMGLSAELLTQLSRLYGQVLVGRIAE